MQVTSGKSSPKAQPIPNRAADHGPRERWQHSGRIFEVTEQAGQCTARVTEEHCLDHWVLAGWLAAEERDAGMRLRADYQAARLENRIIASYSVTRGLNAGGYQAYERDEVEEAAYRRWRDAVKAMAAYGTLVLDACCHDHAPSKQNAVALRRGLSLLRRWYRI
jgi:hypothetical protein